MLNPTPPKRLCDPQGRPYFLWDVDTTLVEFRDALAHGTAGQRAGLIGKLMRQARPDDVFVTPGEIAASWHDVERSLGRTRPFWRWLLRRWRLLPDDQPSAVLQRTPAFVRLRIVRGDEVCLLDLSPIPYFLFPVPFPLPVRVPLLPVRPRVAANWDEPRTA